MCLCACLRSYKIYNIICKALVQFGGGYFETVTITIIKALVEEHQNSGVR
jgi:hypothetical protein